MNEQTKQNIKYITLLASVTDYKGEFIISKANGKFVGINIRFDPELNLDDFPSIKKTMERLQL
jgi:hypothetical protein